MTAERRMDRMEGGLPPKEATLLWLHDAHAHGSLVEYCVWLAGRPLAEAPLERIRGQALTAVRQAMRGVPYEQVFEVESQTLRDAAFLFQLPMRINATAEDTLRIDGLRFGMLSWEMRAISAEGHVDPGPTIAERWARWHANVATLRSELSTKDGAFNLLEGRYLDGHITLFPDTVERWERIREAVEDLARLDGTAGAEGPPPSPDPEAVGAEAERITAEVRAHALDILGARQRTHPLHCRSPSLDDPDGGASVVSGPRSWAARRCNPRRVRNTLGVYDSPNGRASHCCNLAQVPSRTDQGAAMRHRRGLPRAQGLGVVRLGACPGMTIG